MHENLKSSFSIRAQHNQYKSDFLDDNQWQVLSSGSRFGSFFVLYGKIRGVQKSHPDSFMPQECDLYLQTFEGAMTIGLAHNPNEALSLEFGYHPLIRDFAYVLRVKLEPLSTNIHCEKMPVVLQTKNQTFTALQNHKQQRANMFSNGLIPDSTLIVDMTFTDLNGLSITRGVSNQTVIPSNAKSPLVNTDAYVREGSQILKPEYISETHPDPMVHYNTGDFTQAYLNTLQGQFRNKSIIISPMWTEEIEVSDGVIHGLGCHPNNVRIIF